jgi:hypothetical protein
MYAIVVMTALAAPGYGGGYAPCWPSGYGPGYGGGYAHGYGNFRPVVNGCCGVVLPPAWAPDPTPFGEGKVWYDYVMQLDGHEREDMIHVWERATPEARRLLLVKLRMVEGEAAAYRAKVEQERAAERLKIENRPLNEDERDLWRTYLSKLKGDKRKAALERWRGADNRGKRLYLKEILRELEKEEEDKEKEKDKEADKDMVRSKLRIISASQR